LGWGKGTPGGLRAQNALTIPQFGDKHAPSRNAFQENALCAIIAEACMPLSPEQEVLCDRLQKAESTPAAAALIRQQGHEIDDLWDRLSRAYALVRHESPAAMIQEEMEQLQAMLDERQNLQPKKTG
jgi:hypothetical protein